MSNPGHKRPDDSRGFFVFGSGASLLARADKYKKPAPVFTFIFLGLGPCIAYLEAPIYEVLFNPVHFKRHDRHLRARPNEITASRDSG